MWGSRGWLPAAATQGHLAGVHRDRHWAPTQQQGQRRVAAVPVTVVAAQVLTPQRRRRGRRLFRNVRRRCCA